MVGEVEGVGCKVIVGVGFDVGEGEFVGKGDEVVPGVGEVEGRGELVGFGWLMLVRVFAKK